MLLYLSQSPSRVLLLTPPPPPQSHHQSQSRWPRLLSLHWMFCRELELKPAYQSSACATTHRWAWSRICWSLCMLALGCHGGGPLLQVDLCIFVYKLGNWDCLSYLSVCLSLWLFIFFITTYLSDFLRHHCCSVCCVPGHCKGTERGSQTEQRHAGNDKTHQPHEWSQAEW